jgi:hypothetical protein
MSFEFRVPPHRMVRLEQMAKSTKWEPKESLEVSQWNLFPSIGLNPRSIAAAHVAWAAVGLMSMFVHKSPLLAYGMLWLVGHVVVQYMVDRLRGRRANLLSAATIDNEETPFQLRLCFDVLACILLLTSFVVLTVGIPLLRPLFR